MSEVKRYQEASKSIKVETNDQPAFQQSQFQNSQMRVITSETKEVQPVMSKVINTEYELKQPRFQSQRVTRNISTPLMTGVQGFSGQNFQLQQNCQAAQPLCMNVIVVSKEEIEAPWRLECEYLQSLIAELEKKRETKVVEKVVEKVVTDNTRVDQLELELRAARGERENLQSSLKNQLYEAQSEISRLKNELSMRSGNDGKVAQLEQEFSRTRRGLEDQIRALQNQIEDLEAKNRRLESDNSRLQMTIKSREEEINQFRLQLTSLQSNLQEANKYRDLEMQLRMLEDENTRLNGLLKQANAENSQLKLKISELEQDSYSKNNDLVMKMRESETRIITLQTEIDRMNGLLRSRDAELEEWRIKYEELESQGTTVIQEKVTYLSQEVEVWKQKFIKANHDYNSCQEELTMCQAELESLKKGGKRQEVVSTTRTVTRQGGTTTTTQGQLGVPTSSYGGQYTRSEVTRRSGAQS